ncbi:MAG: tRNA glutamyl-Q(34) synthetase GluQRS, partial [Thermoleophilaceae bacterium]
DGRFAPSPTGDLHLGNLRTALLAWLFARSAGSRFLMRLEDLDSGRVRPEFEERQLTDLAAIGLDWDGPVVRQSERIPLYEDALAQLERDGLVYPCYCTRREIREAASAPHGVAVEGAYPGTCRDLSGAERAAREDAGRPPALRLRAGGAVDDFVLRRNDGAFAYNLAVIVDDAEQGIEQVVRGADLADSTPRQVHLAKLLGLREPTYVHVPLMLGPDGSRLAKRHGAVTLADRDDSPAEVLSEIAASVGLCEPGERVTPARLVERFDPAKL